jgi:hypothetical protein
MKLFSSTPRRKVPTPEPAPVHTSKNPYFESSAEKWTKFRYTVLSITGVVIGLMMIGIWMYGPWFTINTVTVKGTVLVKADSVKNATEKYLNGRRWMMFPNRQKAVLSDRGLEKYLTKLISKRLSIEGVQVTTDGPHGIIVTVIERSPVFRWSAGSSVGLIDRHGIIIGPAEGSWDNIPLMIDDTAKPWHVDELALNEDVIKSAMLLDESLTKVKIEVESYNIPIPTCLSELEANMATNNNANNNASLNNTNVASNRNKNTNTVIINVSNTNSSNGGELTNTVNCNKDQIKLQSPEIDINLKDGPKVMFDRYTDLTKAVNVLTNVLAEKENAKATYIDIRFIERVYVK